MNLQTEVFRQLFTEFKKGKSENFFSIIDQSLYIVDEELSIYSEISEPMIDICLLALINSIRLYSYEKAAPFEDYVKNYVHLSLIVAQQTNMFIQNLDFDLAVPSLNLRIPQELLRQYVQGIRQRHVWQQQREETNKIIKKQQN